MFKPHENLERADSLKRFTSFAVVIYTQGKLGKGRFVEKIYKFCCCNLLTGKAWKGQIRQKDLQVLLL
jgi:hypothetical protein